MHSLDIEGFLMTMYDSRTRLNNQIYEEVKSHFKGLVFETVIQRNVKLGEAPSHGLPRPTLRMPIAVEPSTPTAGSRADQQE